MQMTVARPAVAILATTVSLWVRMNRLVRLYVVTLLIATAPLIAMAAVPNYQGMWYNAPAESEAGWGINVAHQGDAIFATWFTHDVNRQAWNLSLSAFQTGPNTFAGTLVVVTGPPFGAVPFNTSQVHAVPVGPATLTFSDANNGTFTYTVNSVMQTKAITRQVFGVVPVCTWGALADLTLATNYTDMWWVVGGAESGWGINFTDQSNAIFATWFTFDLSGNPLPMSATLFKTGPGNTYSGTLIKTGGPPFSAVPWNPGEVTRAEPGTATVTFTNGNRATFAYSVTLNPMVGAVTQTKQIERQVFRPPGTTCAEASGGVATAEGIWRGTTNQGQALTIVILDDGTFYIVFSAQGTKTEVGVLHGSGSSVNGNFNATSVSEYPLSPNPPFIGGAAEIHGTYVPRTTLQLTIGSSSVTASYDPTYDQSANLASLTGTYQGYVGHITEQASAMSVMDGGGNLTINGVQCITTVSATPRGTVNMFNISVTSPTCFNGPGILFYDSAGKKLYALAAFYNGPIPDMWFAIGTRQ